MRVRSMTVGFTRGKTVRRSWLHVQPEAGSRVELLTVREELEPAFDNLHDG